MDAQQENELFQAIGRIEANMTTVCKKFESLPCKENVKEFNDGLKKKPDLKILITTVSLLLFIIGGAFAYTAMVDNDVHDHDTNMDIHHTPAHLKALKK